MELNDVNFGAARPIDAYGGGGFRVGGVRYEGAVLVLPDRVVGWGGYAETGVLVAAAGDIDVLLVGTGAEIAAIPAEMRAVLEGAGVGVDIMATGPACRTFNVLLGEGRRVGAALLPA